MGDAETGRAQNREPGTQNLAQHSEPGAQILEALERGNLFVVPLGEGQQWYRYHRLFADLLRGQLSREHPELVPDLHRRASECFEQHGHTGEAIDHALSAEEFERAARLIDQQAEAALGRGEGATLSRWLEALPSDLVRSRPRLSVFHAAALFMCLRLHEAERRLEDAEAALAAGDVAQAAGERGMVATLRAFMAIVRFDPASMIRFSRQALERLSETDSMWRGIATMVLGDARGLEGDWSAARTAYEEALATGRRAGNGWLVLASSTRLASAQRVRGHLRESADYCRRQLQLAEEGNTLPVARAAWMYALSNVLCEQNELDSALDYARRSCELSDRAGYVFLLAGAYRSLVRVLFARGEMAAAEDAVGRLERLVGAADVHPALADSVIVEWKARLLVARGELSAAARLLADRGIALDREITIANHASHRCLARLLIAQARHEDAVGLLDRLLDRAESAGMVRETIETLALRALALQGQGHLPPALASLERALSLAEPGGFVRIFVNEGPPMSKLLHEAAARGICPEYAGCLLAAFPAGHQPSAPSTRGSEPGTARRCALGTRALLVEPLSQRELEVLRLVAEGLSADSAPFRPPVPRQSFH